MKDLFLKNWKESRTRFEVLLKEITERDLTKKLGNSPNSLGFYIRHVADVELLFAKNIFRLEDVKVTAKTVIKNEDTGEWTSLEELITYNNYAKNKLEEAIKSFPDENWNDEVITKEFGTKSMAEAFGRITSHTAYHAGQMAITLKYGN